MKPHAYRAHDLLWVAACGLRMEGEWPQWLASVAATGEVWPRTSQPIAVVVRREAVSAGWIPVGLRGLARNQRCAAYASADAVRRCASPESLAAGLLELSAGRAGSRQDGDRGAEPCASGDALAVLAAVAPALNATGLAWGPTGGAGYQLATGMAVLRPDSDLDLVVRAPQPLCARQAAALSDALDEASRGATCRVDIQIDTGRGAFALAEWRRGGRRTMLKTDAGPLLCADPWDPGVVP